MWFDPSARLATRVLTRMPDRFRRMGRSEWADANRAGAPVDCFLEGPCFDAAGRLHVVDIPYGRIFRVDDDWTMVAAYDGWPNGLKALPDGALLAADYRRGLMRIDPGAGAATPRVPPGTSGPDGLAMDAADRLYISNPGHGCVWVVDAHGVPRYRIESCAGRHTTNCALAPDGKTLVITESETGSILECAVPAP